jgi:hypothetical protein
LYVFNVAAGQTICLPIIPYLKSELVNTTTPINTPVDSYFCIRIDSIVPTVMANTTLNNYFTSLDMHYYGVSDTAAYAMNWSSIDHETQGVYSKEIGGLIAGLTPVPVFNTQLFHDNYYAQRLQLRCYTDASNNIHINNETCDFLPVPTSLLKIPKRGNLEIMAYPNPATEKVTFSFKEAVHENSVLQIVDLTGRCVYECVIPSTTAQHEINVTSLSNGTYFIKLQNHLGSFQQKLTILR